MLREGRRPETELVGGGAQRQHRLRPRQLERVPGGAGAAEAVAGGRGGQGGHGADPPPVGGGRRGRALRPPGMVTSDVFGVSI